MRNTALLVGMVGLLAVGSTGCIIVRDRTVRNGPVNQPVNRPVGGGAYVPPPATQGAWVKLGERQVDGRVDRDNFEVNDGRAYREILIKVENSPIELYDMVVVRGNGEVFRPNVRQRFGANSTSRAIDLPGVATRIQRVQFLYRDLPGGGRASVELWAR